MGPEAGELKERESPGIAQWDPEGFFFGGGGISFTSPDLAYVVRVTRQEGTR